MNCSLRLVCVRPLATGVATQVASPVKTKAACRGAMVLLLILVSGLVNENWAATSPSDRPGGAPLKQLSLAELGNVEVTTASKEPEEVWKTPAAVYVLTQEDIRRSGATSIPEVLRLVPGVQVSRIDNDHWAVGIRGFADQFSKSMLVLVDGRSLYTPLFAGVYWALQDGILLEDVERIEVIRGPGGTLWGANAVNGVINIITKHPEELQKHAGTFNFILDCVSAAHDVNAYLSLLKPDGTMTLVGAPEKPFPVSAFNLIMGRHSLSGSAIGGIRETQEMLDFCAEHGITADIEKIRIQQINDAYARLLKSDVKYRFVIDMASLQ